MSDDYNIRYERVHHDNGDIEYRAVFELPQEWTDEQRKAFAEEFRREVNRRFLAEANRRLDGAAYRFFLE